jgi:hypothetical protein
LGCQNQALFRKILNGYCLALAEQLWQLGDVGGNPPSFVSGEDMRYVGIGNKIPEGNSSSAELLRA